MTVFYPELKIAKGVCKGIDDKNIYEWGYYKKLPDPPLHKHYNTRLRSRKSMRKLKFKRNKIMNDIPVYNWREYNDRN